MSTLSPSLAPRTAAPRHAPLPPEPVFQQGVRQYLGVATAWICLVIAVLALALWVRGQFVVDTVSWFHNSGSRHLRSENGALLIVRRVATSPSRQTSLDLTSRPLNLSRVRPWPSGVASTLGVQWTRGSPFREIALGDGSWWLRVWLPNLAALAMVFPVARFVVRRRHRRLATTAGFGPAAVESNAAML